MNDRLGESVSALVDGEADELELRRLLAGESFDQVRTMWSSLQRASDRAPGLDTRFASIDISARVMTAINDIEQERSARWWRPMASVAVAASVAAVVAVGMRSFDGFETSSQAQPQLASAPTAKVYPASVSSGVGNVAVSANASSSPTLQPVALDADELARQQLDHYLLRHTERAVLNGGQGVVGFARVTHLESE